jgi:ribitol-5-phosphate 2-dehydrogenase (NADP+) / D-ribitol-5-phosphate cytidylyltransferase
MKTIAVILSGGQGSRFGTSVPKQYTKLAGKMVIEHTLSIFQSHPLIDEVCIVAHKDYIKLIEKSVLHNLYSKVMKILIGGDERYESSLVAIQAYNQKYSDDTKILFHDSVRPFVDHDTISRCITALDQYDAVDVAIGCSDTIIEVDRNVIIDIPNRNRLRSGQTPQAFKLSTIKSAYDLALVDPNFKTTDDCGVIKKYLPSKPIFVVEGSNTNIKITYKEDIYIADRLFQLKSLHDSAMAIGTTQNILSNMVVVVFGGSYGIGFEIAKLVKNYGGKVHVFSRSETNTDISSLDDVKFAVDSVLKLEGHIHAVINTAGILIKQPLLNMSTESIKQVIDINVTGAINVALASANALMQTKGMLLLFTSSSFTRGRAFYSTYSASKAAVVNLCQALSEEWADKEIRVNCINPERTRTPMRMQNFGNELEDTLLDPAEVAERAIEVLLSNNTGAVIDVRLTQ